MGPVMSSPDGAAGTPFSGCYVSCDPPRVRHTLGSAGNKFDCHLTPCDLATEYSLLFVVSAKAARHDAIRGNGETYLGTVPRGSSDDDRLPNLRLHQFPVPVT